MSRPLKDTALRRLKATYRSDAGSVLPSLERYVMRQQGDDPERDTTVLHPSDMSHKEWCWRSDYYRIVGTPKEKSSKANPSFRMENLFAEGHTIHGKYQTWLWEMGVLYGTWKCSDCSHRWEALSPALCPRCGLGRIHYKEVPLRRKGSLVGGHADGAIHDLDGYTGLIEIKSIGLGTLRFEAPRLLNLYEDGELSLDQLWWRINRPFSSHMRQAQLYLWLSWPRYDRICFIYEAKFNQQTKEFVVEYNPQIIAPLLERDREVSQHVGLGTPPSRPDWAEDEQVTICRSCHYRKTCWSIDDATNTPSGPAAGDPVRVRRTKQRRRPRPAA